MYNEDTKVHVANCTAGHKIEILYIGERGAIIGSFRPVPDKNEANTS